MTVMLYGGSFNPPHPAHVRAARLAFEALRPDRLVIMPAADPPHKALAENSPSPMERLELTRLAFMPLRVAEVSDLELRRGGESFTSDTVRELSAIYDGAQIILVMGSDMLLTLETWHEAEWLMRHTRIVVLSREPGEARALEICADYLRQRYLADIRLLPAPPLPMSSSKQRELLRTRRGAYSLNGDVYERIIKYRSYGAKPELRWLRRRVMPFMKPKRMAHVLGCEHEAASLSERWGEDGQDAAEAAILHDITKKLSLDEQLLLADKYGIVFDKIQRENLKLTHAVTGAALARDIFGVTGRVYDAIRWHTTGRPGMSLLEKIIYMADYIEPTREFPGVEQLRRLAYTDLDEAMRLGLEMSLEDLRSGGIEPHPDTYEALAWYRKENS